MKRIAGAIIVLLLIVLAIPFVYFATGDLNDFQDPLLNAARDGDVDTIRMLLADGASVNKSVYGNRPLTIAAYFGQTEAAAFLLKNGAALDGTGNSGMTPLHCAVYHRHFETAQLFLKNHADPNATDEFGETPLAIAARNGDATTVEFLVNSGANTESACALGWHPLHIVLRSTTCTESERLATVATLLKHGADPNAKNPGGFERDSEYDSHIGYRPVELPNQGNTPLAIATSNGFKEIANLLVKHGAE